MFCLFFERLTFPPVALSSSLLKLLDGNELVGSRKATGIDTTHGRHVRPVKIGNIVKYRDAVDGRYPAPVDR